MGIDALSSRPLEQGGLVLVKTLPGDYVGVGFWQSSSIDIIRHSTPDAQ